MTVRWPYLLALVLALLILACSCANKKRVPAPKVPDIPDTTRDCSDYSPWRRPGECNSQI